MAFEKFIKDLQEYVNSPSSNLDSCPTVGYVKKEPFSNFYDLLGEGSYAEVYDLYDGTVAKVLTYPDPNYIEYAKLCIGKDNPFMPNIKSIDYTFGDYAVIHIEKLNENAFLAKMLLYIIKNQYITIYGKEILEGDNIDALQYYKEEKVGVKLGKFIESIERQGITCNDIHSDNIMFRGIFPVLTDPCTSQTIGY